MCRQVPCQLSHVAMVSRHSMLQSCLTSSVDPPAFDDLGGPIQEPGIPHKGHRVNSHSVL